MIRLDLVQGRFVFRAALKSVVAGKIRNPRAEIRNPNGKSCVRSIADGCGPFSGFGFQQSPLRHRPLTWTLALHDGDRDTTWTNLLAATRIVTAWQIEPTEVSVNVRLLCLRTAYGFTWQVLQAGNWSDRWLTRGSGEGQVVFMPHY